MELKKPSVCNMPTCSVFACFKVVYHIGDNSDHHSAILCGVHLDHLLTNPELIVDELIAL